MFACIYVQKTPAEMSGAPAGLPGRRPRTLSDFAYTFSPLVEETAPNLVVIDVEGCALRFGSL